MLASFLSLRAVGSQLMSTSRPMALCRARDDPTPTPRWPTGNRHGFPFVGVGVFSLRRRMNGASRVCRIPIALDRGSEPTVTGRPATHGRAPGWSPATQTGSPCTADVSPPVRRKTETLRQQRIEVFRKPTAMRTAEGGSRSVDRTVRTPPPASSPIPSPAEDRLAPRAAVG